ncbi:exosome complex component CSL4 isoform X4 [Gracilinanus agilis]|uniref:exosome complex component CSL4 isoform X4 n=1 Tax=Gracilinanus agilis TaxID=191870 RepID=UPI001CFF02CF|nr:exosome complex component CSL4 isoform X4 [Gracilinanus agilis]
MAPPLRYCVPGERLCNVEEASPGSGTYTRHGYIFSSLSGCLVKTSDNGELPVVSVTRETESQLLPDVGTIVTCKVSSINSRFAKVHILYVGSTPLKNSFRGTIRKEDVRATEKDKVIGVQMVPISWCEMQCPRTHTKEFRKVARVQPEFLQT